MVSEVLGSPSSPAPAAKARTTAQAAAPPSLRVEVVWGDITKVQGDVYAVGHYHGVPPKTRSTRSTARSPARAIASSPIT